MYGIRGGVRDKEHGDIFRLIVGIISLSCFRIN